MLRAWGGNASGSGIANIDNTGEVHPDTYWWQHSVGNVRHTPFRTLWLDQPDALLSRLREPPPCCGRPLRAMRLVAHLQPWVSTQL